MPFAPSEMTLTSSAFQANGAISTRHTGEGDDQSPPLAWDNPPKGTQGFAIFCLDPDAPLVSPEGQYGFVHWVLYNLPATARSLDEATSEGTPGINNFDKVGYGGPLPPPAHGTHRYYFWILALDAELDLLEGLSLWEFLKEAEPHILGMSRLVGTYERK